MAKGKRNNPSRRTEATTNTPRQAATRQTESVFTARENRPTPSSEQDPLLKKIFMGIALVGLLWMLFAAMGTGVNADDKFQDDYSEKLVSYYSTFGKDTSALYVKDGNMHIYGGFFEILTGFTNKTLGLTPDDNGYHQVRHVFSATLGWVAILCAALLAWLIAGWRAAIFTFLFMLLSPRFFGHSLMNPKDIPFAAGYMMVIYNLAQVLKSMPQPKKRHLAGLAAGLGIALAMRAGGLLPFAIAFLFFAVHFFWKNGLAGLGQGRLVGRYAAVAFGTAAVGYFGAVLFWPFAMQAPLKNPLDALSKFEQFAIHIRVLYDGLNIMSDTTPSIYPLKWMWMTIPLAILAGFVGFFVLLPKMLRKYEPTLLALVAFAAVFPVAYVMYKNSVLYDGWRHLIFAFPPLAVLAGLFWNELTTFFQEKKALQYAVYGVASLLMLDAAAFQVMNPSLAYVYFNPIQGGTKGAIGHYETDYWGVSTQKGLEWLEKENIIGPNMTAPVTIATNMFYPAKKYLTKYGDKVILKYVKWDRRCDLPYDYALFPTRFIDGAALQKGMWPPDNTIHTIEAGGAPILAILKNNNQSCNEGIEATKKGDWPTAIEKFKQTVADVPDQDLAWAQLANSYLNANQPEEGKAAAEKALAINPNDAQAGNVIGLYYLRKNDGANAKKAFNEALQREPSNPGALYYLALISQSEGNPTAGINHLNNCIKIAPNFKPAYELAAQLYEATGDAGRAQQYRAAAAQIR